MKILIISVSIIFLFLIIFSNIKVKINFKRHDKDDILIINIIVLYGIFTYKRQIPFMDLVTGRNDIPAVELKSDTSFNDKYSGSDKSVVNFNEFEKILDKYKELYIKFKKYIVPFMRYVKQKIVLKNIDWKTEVGVDDAAQTAIITGLIWSMKSSMISFIHNNFNLYDVFINVVPNYNNKTLKTSIDCIFTIKLGDIINAGIKTLLVKVKDGEDNE